MVAVAFVGNFLATGTGLYAFNAFMLPLCLQNGWTRAEMNVAPMLGFACGLGGQFIYGTLLGRVGPRLLMSLGPLLSSAAFIAMGNVRGLGWFYLCYCLLLMGNGAMGGIVASTAVTSWFDQGRGRALGLATVGISLAGVILPPAAAWLMGLAGIGGAFAVIGAAILAASPLAWFLVRDAPGTAGPNTGGPRPAGEQSPWSPRRLAGSPVFWRLGSAYALAMMGVMGVMFQLGPRFEDEGYPVGMALALVSATALMGALGKYCWSALCDRRDPLKVVGWLMVANAAGLGLGLVMRSVPGAAAFVVVFGFSMGGIMSTYPTITAHLFGRASFPVVFRFLLMFTALQVLGYLVMGQAFAWAGSYDLAFAVFLFLDLAAAALVFSLVNPPPGGAPETPRREV